MPLLESVQKIQKLEAHLGRLVWDEWFGTRVAIPKPTAKRLGADQHLISSHMHSIRGIIVIRRVIRENINELYDPVGIGSGC